MDVARHAPARSFFRFLAVLAAVFIALGMAAVAIVLAGEDLAWRERAFFAAALAVMGFFLWACIRPGQARQPRSRRLLVAVYAAALLVVFSTMLIDSGSLIAWAGFVLFANVTGVALFLPRRTAQR